SVVACFESWCNSNNLIANIAKTQIVYFQSLGSDSKLRLKYNDTILESTDSVKFLGVWLDCYLRWNVHIDKVINSLNRAFYAVYRIRNVMPLRALLDVYYSLVYSHLSYNTILWGNAINSNRVFIIVIERKLSVLYLELIIVTPVDAYLFVIKY
ncbi:hypothetical protein NQ315_014490, partial [Exocentrus adspersus]